MEKALHQAKQENARLQQTSNTNHASMANQDNDLQLIIDNLRQTNLRIIGENEKLFKSLKDVEEKYTAMAAALSQSKQVNGELKQRQITEASKCNDEIVALGRFMEENAVRLEECQNEEKLEISSTST